MAANLENAEVLQRAFGKGVYCTIKPFRLWGSGILRPETLKITGLSIEVGPEAAITAPWKVDGLHGVPSIGWLGNGHLA